jgi:ABC-type antimicrobial peptide transport system permease subunit
MNTLDLALKELTRRRKLYLLSIVALSVVTALIITLNCLGTAYRSASRLPFEDIQGTIIVQRNGNVPENISGVLLSCSLAPIGPGLAPQIETYDGVKSVSRALSLWVFDTDNFKRVVGVDWSDKFGVNLASKVVSGTTPNNNWEVLLEKTYAEQHGLEVGQQVEVDGQIFKVSGIVVTAGNEIVGADIYTNLELAQSMAYASENLQQVEPFGQHDVNIIFVDAAQPSIAAVSQRIESDAADLDLNSGETPLGQTIGDYNIYTPQSFESQISSLFQLSDKLTRIISIVVFAAGALVIARSVLHGILERRKEFGIMKSVGFRNHDIQKGIFITTALQAIAGFAIGLAISAGAIGILSRTKVSISIPWELTAYPHFLLTNPEAANVTQVHSLPISLEPIYVVAALLTTAVIGLMAAFLGTYAVNRLKPMQVMKYE